MIEGYFSQFLLMHHILAPIIFIFIRIITVVIPPLPGIIIDIPAIIAFGWWQGFIFAEFGVMVGAMIAFYIARFFREPIIRRVVSLKQLEQWEQKLSTRQTFWALVAIRIPTFSVFDVINYAAGLTHIKTKTFFFATLLGSFPSMFIFFYLGEYAFSNKIFFLAMIFSIIFLWFIFKYKN
jgi:uncharacterized membrane protein YdjX (TVP38/TMEM64 family)